MRNDVTELSTTNPAAEATHHRGRYSNALVDLQVRGVFDWFSYSQVSRCRIARCPTQTWWCFRSGPEHVVIRCRDSCASEHVCWDYPYRATSQGRA
ncbi:hypothetical protein IG631_18681 [Alternaria alternata]|nr:hypothetical protein IG631_18681 [Alternaria alternata]